MVCRGHRPAPQTAPANVSRGTFLIVPGRSLKTRTRTSEVKARSVAFDPPKENGQPPIGEPAVLPTKSA